jgi:ribosome recycling factor
MNAERRKEIAKAHAMIDEAKSILEAARDEEQEFFENMPENMQEGEKGSAAENAVQSLEEAIDGLETAMGNCDAATE